MEGKRTRGRPRKDPNERRDKQILIKVTPEEQLYFIKLAAEKGLTYRELLLELMKEGV